MQCTLMIPDFMQFSQKFKKFNMFKQAYTQKPLNDDDLCTSFIFNYIYNRVMPNICDNIKMECLHGYLPKFSLF